MHRLIKYIKNKIDKHSRVCLFLTVGLVLLLSIYLNWRLAMKHAFMELSYSARRISDTFDAFIEDLLQDIYSLPMQDKAFTDCKSGLFDSVERININNPLVSGLLLSDDSNQLNCSTLPKSDALSLTSERPRTLTGPYQLPFFEQTSYLIQQRMGNYRIGMVLIASLLEKKLKPHDPMVGGVVLYNDKEKKVLLQLKPDKKHPTWKRSAISTWPDSLSAKEPIQSIEGLQILVFAHQKAIWYTILWRECIVHSVLIALGFLIYFLIKRFIIRHYSLRTALKLALKNDAFYPVYHPIFNTEKGAYVGAEILLRWQLNPNEIMMPDTFIKEAETSGLIVPITLALIKNVFHSSFQRLPSSFYLTFNLSASHFKDTAFFEAFYQLVEQYAILPQQIVFEITERELLDRNDPIFLGTMQELRQKGYSLAVDDFGTGHASISYLQHFPFNYLKIDKLFIQAIGTHAITESLNETIIDMANKLHLIVIAEGVETQSQADYFSKKGVHLQQGWFYTKELSFDNLSKLINGG